MQLAVGQAVVVEHGTDALLPLAALIDERVTQPHLRAQVKDVIGWDPRLRQPPDHQQLPQMLRISAVALGSLLVAAQRARLGRLSQMHTRVDAPQLLNDEPPARRRLERHLKLSAREPTKKATHALTVRRRHPRPADLPGRRVQPLRRDLRSMLIQSHYDRHLSLLRLHRLTTCANYPRLSRGGPTHAIFWRIRGAAQAYGLRPFAAVNSLAVWVPVVESRRRLERSPVSLTG